MMIKQAISTSISRELTSCITCNKCLDICPVYPKSFTVKELNNSLKNTSSISPEIIDFTFSCMQCRQCVPVCPKGLHRDEMMLFMKHLLGHQKPRNYKRYVLIRGPKLSFFRSFLQELFVFVRKKQNREIAKYMESRKNTKNSLLFYPGCYIYSPKTITQTLRLLHHVGKPFSVLAGLSHCCGMPYYLQGDFQQTEKCLTNLKKQLQQINPTLIISGCNECLEAIQLINRYYHTSYQTKTIVEYLLDNSDKFTKVSTKKPVTFHESCRYNRDKNKAKTSRQAIKKFCTLNEMKQIQSNAICCAHWNYEFSTMNDVLRRKRLVEAKKAAPIMVCECLTCYEHFSKIDTDRQVIDILDLFDQSLDANTKT